MYSFFKKYLNIGDAMEILVIHIGLREFKLNYSDYIIFFGIFIGKPFFLDFITHMKHSTQKMKRRMKFISKNCLIFSIKSHEYQKIIPL